jgi:arylsulfatase A-like enzyme
MIGPFWSRIREGLRRRRKAWSRRTAWRRRRAAARGLIAEQFRGAHLQSQPRHVLVVAVDALRRDHVSVYGGERDTTPFLRSLAETSAVYTQAVSPAAWTFPAVASLLSGLYPHHHGATYAHEPRNFDQGQMPAALRDDVVLLPEVLAGLGFDTYFASAIAFAEFVGRGRFAHVWSCDLAEADLLTERYLTWLGARHDARTFAYLHLSDPHEPLRVAEPHRSVFGAVEALPGLAYWGAYTAEGPYDAAFERFRAMRLKFYDAAVRFVDAQLARLVDALRVGGLLEQTLLIVTADHGEAFWEHTELERAHFFDPRPWYGVSHGHHLFRETIEVPLMVCGPGVPRGWYDGRVSGVDLVPTVLGLLGIETSVALDGVNLMAAPAERAVLSEATGYGYEKQAVLEGDLKLYTSRGDDVAWVFDLKADPEEQCPTENAEARAALSRHLPTGPGAGGVSEAMDEEVRERLRALGYLG